MEQYQELNQDLRVEIADLKQKVTEIEQRLIDEKNEHKECRKQLREQGELINDLKASQSVLQGQVAQLLKKDEQRDTGLNER